LGIAVVCLQPTSPGELEPYWLELGRLTGHEPQAKAMAETFAREVAGLRVKTAAIPAGQRKRVFFESIHRQMKTISPDSMAAYVLTNAGAVNLAVDAQPVSGTNIAHFGLERVVALGDTLDAYLAQSGPMNPVSVEEIRSTPGLSGLAAVREGRVFLVDEAQASRPTPRLLEGMRAVYSILYPDNQAKEGGL
jgi:iron complex transport system substrate-binding protein